MYVGQIENLNTKERKEKRKKKKRTAHSSENIIALTRRKPSEADIIYVHLNCVARKQQE